MIDVTQIKLTLDQFSNGGPLIATAIAPINPFRDGRVVTDEVTGRKVTVVCPENGYATFDVKVSDPTDALTPLIEKSSYTNPVFVDFPGFVGRIYPIRDKDAKDKAIKEIVVSAKADAVRMVPAPGSDPIIE